MNASEAVGALRPVFGGRMIQPADSGYAAAREIWNAAITKQPALIAQCREAGDISAAVRVARELGLEIAIRGGGHNVAGTALTDNGIVIDLSGMKRYRIDSDARTITAEMGLTWGEFDAATQLSRLGTPGGIVSTTGVAGLSLGGGFGWLSRLHGWTCDNVLSARMITYNGELVEASATVNPDLYWALRGGGGNFGVVHSMKYRLHEVHHVTAGFLVYALHDAADVLAHCAEVMSTASDSVCLVIGIGPPPAIAAAAGRRVLRIALCDARPEAAGQHLASAIRSYRRPLFDHVGLMSYMNLQTMLDAGGVRGLGHYAKSHFLSGLSDEAISVLLDHAGRCVSDRSRIVLHTCGGQSSRKDETDTAFGHRDAAYNLQIDSTWRIGDDPAAHISWARELFTAMTPFSTGGVYVNFLGEDADDAAVSSAYGAQRLRRLRLVKDQFDPQNVFHVNQNIRPTRQPAGHLEA